MELGELRKVKSETLLCSVVIKTKPFKTMTKTGMFKTKTKTKRPGLFQQS